MSRKWLAIVLCSLWGVAAATADTPPRSDLAQRIEGYLRPFVEAGHLSGTVLVARNGEVVFERAYGMANYELGVPNTPETKHCIASINKPLTIAVVCQLAEDHKLDPSDPVAKWIPDFPRGDRITVSLLLNHRAGIPHRVTTAAEESRFLSAEDMVERVSRAEFLFEPGERSVYSSAGYSVLARIVELVEGKPFGQALDERVFRKAGMTHSVEPGFGTLIPDRATSYVPTPDGVMNAELKDLSFLVGAGAVFSTAGDVHLAIRALLDGKLGQTARTALLRDTGLGWNGITNGYRAFADFDKETGVEVIFTGNLHTGAVDRLREAIPEIVAGEAVPPPQIPHYDVVNPDVQTLLRYEGRYESERGQSFSLRVRDGMMFAGDRLLVPTSDRSFFSLQDYGRVNVIFDDAGAVERLDWEWGGEFWPWRRTGPPEPY